MINAQEGEDAQWVSLRQEGPKMQGASAALLALGRGLVLWHESELADPTATHPVQGGHARSCLISATMQCFLLSGKIVWSSCTPGI